MEIKELYLTSFIEITSNFIYNFSITNDRFKTVQPIQLRREPGSFLLWPTSLLRRWRRRRRRQRRALFLLVLLHGYDLGLSGSRLFPKIWDQGELQFLAEGFEAESIKGAEHRRHHIDNYIVWEDERQRLVVRIRETEREREVRGDLVFLFGGWEYRWFI